MEKQMIWEFILRLVVAAIFGALIGLDREYRAKEAGTRTHFLVALGSALFMIVSQWGFQQILTFPAVSLDPSRIAAGVVTGIGFIGAGTIIIQKHFIKGLTTAAGLWATSAIGVTIGCGLYAIGIAATILALLGLELSAFWAGKFGIHSTAIVFATQEKEELHQIVETVHQKEYHLTSYETETQQMGTFRSYRVSLVVRTKKENDKARLVRFIQTLPGVTIEKIES